ncbi:hypothetical protein BC939DRAFT_519785 [Gamsiella multidivaricata]|uniref:uncharacterized protein n=1 Tax=Gamsiella multidivaricata TaxID=101098 RepID=UPI00221F9A0F|nr:uncharacterized protein BC939DRAFT_519785 [Gamsiella multidivaricata]KAG0358034.1 hypothetical protein BGZ54_000084 [Gamsiella multidivaricata]KAI7820282.1 hypothetical protein BC939DRAFT_519785 [Gamsiella multidivaricata]
MKFIASAFMISAAFATITSAVPLRTQVPTDTKTITHAISKRCTECTNTDNVALDLIVKASADHYSDIARARLDSLMNEIKSTKVTPGTEESYQETTVLSVTVQTKIDEAKRACSPEALAPIIKETVAADENLNIPWSKKEEIERKIADLDTMITKLMLERIQNNIDAESLSKDCTEKMTNTEITPAPAPSHAEESATAQEPAPAQAPAHAPKPVPAAAQPCTECTGASSSNTQPGIDVAGNVDSKFVCKTGCKDSNDAKTVLSLRVDLERQFRPRLDRFYVHEVPTACEEERGLLLGGVLKLVADLNDNTDA